VRVRSALVGQRARNDPLVAQETVDLYDKLDDHREVRIGLRRRWPSSSGTWGSHHGPVVHARGDDQSVLKNGVESSWLATARWVAWPLLLSISFSATEGMALMAGSRSPEIRARMARRQVEADELAAHVGELRLAGLTYRDIAKGVGCSLGAAYEGWKRFRKSLVRGDIADERDVLLGRCEKLLRQLATKLQAGDVQAVRAATEVLRLMSDVGGYAMPAQVEVKGGVPSYSRFEFVVEPIPGAVAGQGSPEDDPLLEDSQRRLLAPAENPEPVEVS
jgi:hypothetical protein